jgi:hypothetical protein
MAMTPDIDERSVTLIRDPMVHIPLSHCRAATRPDRAVHMVGCRNCRRDVAR